MKIKSSVLALPIIALALSACGKDKVQESTIVTPDANINQSASAASAEEAINSASDVNTPEQKDASNVDTSTTNTETSDSVKKDVTIEAKSDDILKTIKLTWCTELQNEWTQNKSFSLSSLERCVIPDEKSTLFTEFKDDLNQLSQQAPVKELQAKLDYIRDKADGFKGKTIGQMLISETQIEVDSPLASVSEAVKSSGEAVQKQIAELNEHSEQLSEKVSEGLNIIKIKSDEVKDTITEKSEESK